jgi:ferritin-like metal-binding protein YciE
MSAPESLHDLYSHEMQDLYSANDQMAKVVKKLITKASDEALKEMLTKSVDGINTHTETLKSLIEAAEGKVSKEHCKGMEGLVAEATKHTGEEAPKKGPLLDAIIIAQYQRMSHYGLAGFGTAAAYAEALGNKDGVTQLKQIVKDIYGGDQYATKLAETSVNIDAKAE